MSEPNGRGAAWGPVTVLGAHILDVLGRPVGAIPPGQGSARLQEIRATAAGTAAGAGVDLAKLGARVLAVGALGDDLLGDIVVAAMARHGVDTSRLSRKRGVQTSATILPIRANGERPALHVPGRPWPAGSPPRPRGWPTMGSRSHDRAHRRPAAARAGAGRALRVMISSRSRSTLALRWPADAKPRCTRLHRAWQGEPGPGYWMFESWVRSALAIGSRELDQAR